jgi:hypothetical protein
LAASGAGRPYWQPAESSDDLHPPDNPPKGGKSLTIGVPGAAEVNGRGEFFNQETLNGRAIHVRFVFSDITPTSFRFEQAFSGDGGKPGK